MSIVLPRKRLTQTCISFKCNILNVSKITRNADRIMIAHVIHSVIVLICYVTWQTGRYGQVLIFSFYFGLYGRLSWLNCQFSSGR